MRKEADKASAIANCKQTRGANSCDTLVPIILDVTNEQHVEDAFSTVQKWVEEHKKPFVALVNNAGIAEFNVVEVAPLTQYRQGLELN